MDPVIQPGFEHFQQCDIHNSGQPVGVLHHLHSKDFVPSPSSKPTLFQLEAIPLVLSLQALVRSPSPAFFRVPFMYWKVL